jgi:hypothetical protein
MGGAMLLLVGGAAYKIGQADAQRIQQHTGKPPEDLSEQELEQAMDDLGIQDQELTPQDQAAIEAQAIPDPGSPPPPAPASRSAPASSPAAGGDYITELERLADLRDRGIITPEDFEAKKRQLLGL